MRRALLLLLLCGAAGASTVTVEPGPGVTVKFTRNKTDTGRIITINGVNKSDVVKVVPATPPIDHSMHAGIDVGFTGWPARTIEAKFGPLLTTGNPVPPLDMSNEGAMRTVCGFWKFLYDDPIVYPGQPGAAHHHTFYTPGIDAFTTAANIRAPGNGSTCRGGTVNLTGYWHASLIDTAKALPLAPLPLIVYYKTGSSPYMDPRQTAIEAFPAGLRMVAGNAGASAPTTDSPYGWSCLANAGTSNGQEVLQGQTIPSCAAGDWLRMKVNFKQCWNGQLDSPDHRSHLTDPVRVDGADPRYDPYRPLICPADHSHLLPIITVIAQWNLPAGTDYSKLRLASDVYAGPAGYSAHVDWFNGWDQQLLDVIRQNCWLNRRDCGSFTDGAGRAGVEWDGN